MKPINWAKDPDFFALQRILDPELPPAKRAAHDSDPESGSGSDTGDEDDEGEEATNEMLTSPIYRPIRLSIYPPIYKNTNPSLSIAFYVPTLSASANMITDSPVFAQGVHTHT